MHKMYVEYILNVKCVPCIVCMVKDTWVKIEFSILIYSWNLNTLLEMMLMHKSERDSLGVCKKCKKGWDGIIVSPSVKENWGKATDPVYLLHPIPEEQRTPHPTQLFSHPLHTRSPTDKIKKKKYICSIFLRSMDGRELYQVCMLSW